MSIGTISISSDMYFGILSSYIEYLRKNRNARKIVLFSQIIILILLGSLRIFSSHIFENGLLDSVNEWSVIFLALTGLFLFVTLLSYTSLKFDNNGLVIELDGLRKEREEIKKKISENDDDIFNTIQLSLNQLTEYYTINLSQARSSYRWSITAIVVGILTLLAGIWFIFFDTNPKLDLAIISGISGVIIEFIGASNLYVYNKSLKQLNLYFKELLRIQDTMLAIELCEKIKDNEPKKIEIKEKIILSLMERSSMRTEFLDDYKKKTST